MIFTPIEIRVTDNKKYTELALLFDRPDFLQDIDTLRLNHIPSLMTPEKLWETFETLADSGVLGTGREIPAIPRARFMLYKNFEYSNELRLKYRKGFQFDAPILVALVCNKVSDNDLMNTAKYQKLDSSIDLETVSVEDEDKFSLIVNSDTTEQDLIAEFRKAKAELSRRKKIDTKPNIRRDREWYWLYKEGNSYGAIQKMASKKGEHITRDGVIKAVKAYSAMLTVEL